MYPGKYSAGVFGEEQSGGKCSEYNEEEHMRMEREDAFADGLQEGVRRERINTERERLRAEEEKRRAEEEKQRVQEEKLRADQAEAEVLRLKEELAKMSKRK